MGMLTTISSVMFVIFIAVVLLKRPDQENRTLLIALMVLQIILIVLDLLWK